MLLLIQAPRARVIAVLDGAGVRGCVGPTSTGGWTAAWCELSSDDLVPAPAEPHVSIAEEDDAEVVVRISGRAEVVSRPSLEPSSHAGAAQALVDSFGARDPSTAGRIADVLGDPGIDVDELVALLVELLALPEVTEPEPEHFVLVTHCDVAFVRAAARLQGPLRVLAVDEGTTLVGHTTDTCDVTSAAAAISASEPRRDRTLVLWTRGQTLSLCVLRRGSPVGEWTWEETWSSTGAGRAAQPAELLAQIEAFAAGAADVPRVRRLLAQQEAPSPGELLSALALPPQVIDALGHDGLAVVPGSVLVGPATARAALLGSALDAWSHPRPSRGATACSMRSTPARRSP